MLRAWDDVPSKCHASGRDWFGGDLLGIEQHLDHVERVGANVIYMTPIFPATSTHRYDATTFERVDPLLGGDAAFDSLARACAERGIRLVGDLTTNHVGWKHDWFVAAEADHHAPERSFFYFDETLPYGYEAWFGVEPASSTGATTSYGPGCAAWCSDTWARLSGWRIDVANMTGRFARSTSTRGRPTSSGTRRAHCSSPSTWDCRGDLDGRAGTRSLNYSSCPTWW